MISPRVPATAAIYLILAALAFGLVHRLVPHGPARKGAELAVFWAAYAVAILLFLESLMAGLVA